MPRRCSHATRRKTAPSRGDCAAPVQPRHAAKNRAVRGRLCRAGAATPRGDKPHRTGATAPRGEKPRRAGATVPRRCSHAERGLPRRAGAITGTAARITKKEGQAPLFLLILCKAPAHQHAHDGRHHKSARPAGRIAQAEKPAHVRVQVFVHLHPVAVKFKLR